MDLKPAPRVKNPSLMRLLKIEYDECELSGETSDLHLHHVIFKSHGGDDMRQNIICLVEGLHTLYHRGDAETRRRVGEHVNEVRTDVAGYIADKLGGPDPLLEWFARHGVAA